MAKTKKDKKNLVDSYKTKIQSSKGFVVVQPTKITPNEINEFRKEIYDFNSSFNVVKNSLFKIALKDESIENLGLDKGEYAVLFLNDDFVNTIKSLKKFIQSTKGKDTDERIQIISGFLENSVLKKSSVEELAEMPDKNTSISLILGVLDNALSSIVNVLEDAPRSYATIIDLAFKEEK